ncbi:putative transcription factor and/or regulators TTF-type(Zn) family [Helianthus annuus]|uniref:Putative zinc finger, TTF-type n=1 Tax=Helianthus annuus TaxID=4232 RepID=A0A251TS16_HELAN|nr:putative transcription factor and/or regulators TTF-type(Zn) family [Helianthus annuus]KAJ0891721.1 putative transcription factor and/or regulators TTF-type(Zn) family [Helianthus annuus]
MLSLFFVFFLNLILILGILSLSKQLKENQITRSDQKDTLYYMCTIPIQETLHLPPSSGLPPPPSASHGRLPLLPPSLPPLFMSQKFCQIMQESLKRKFHVSSSSSNNRMRIDLEDLPWDPSERKSILSYDVNQRDEIRRTYLNNGPCQPQGHVFPKRDIGGRLRQFSPDWFKEFGCWLEYSVKSDAVFCLVCYLFKESGKKYAFVTHGYNGWNKKDRLGIHVGKPNSFHNKTLQNMTICVNQNNLLVVPFKSMVNLAKNTKSSIESD